MTIFMKKNAIFIFKKHQLKEGPLDKKKKKGKSYCFSQKVEGHGHFFDFCDFE
jgi:hypothetical protein